MLQQIEFYPGNRSFRAHGFLQYVYMKMNF